MRTGLQGSLGLGNAESVGESMNENVKKCKSHDELFWRCVIFIPIILIGVPVLWLLFFVKFLIGMVVEDCADIKNELSRDFRDGVRGVCWIFKSVRKQWKELGEKSAKHGQSSSLTR